jgi:predicted lipid-binding transport protein (Tim44 family)
MESTSPARPLAGMRGRLESPEEHWARHDKAQLRFWLTRSFAERLAQAERYRMRQFGDGPHVFPRTFRLLPSVVTDER